jgi:single-strand DNA-binding protein
MANVNKVFLVGRLGADPIVRETASGAVANFSIATNEYWTDKQGDKVEKTEWHNIVAWGKQAELSRDYLTKGSNIFCEGKLQTSKWDTPDGETKYKTEIVIHNLQFLDPKKDSESSTSSIYEYAPKPEAKPVLDDVPF